MKKRKEPFKSQENRFLLVSDLLKRVGIPVTSKQLTALSGELLAADWLKSTLGRQGLREVTSTGIGQTL